MSKMSDLEIQCEEIARKLILYLELDNYGSQVDRHFERGYGPIPSKVIGAIASMYAQGCEFTEADLWALVAGENTETKEKYGKYQGFQTVYDWLNYVFGEQDTF